MRLFECPKCKLLTPAEVRVDDEKHPKRSAQSVRPSVCCKGCGKTLQLSHSDAREVTKRRRVRESMKALDELRAEEAKKDGATRKLSRA